VEALSETAAESEQLRALYVALNAFGDDFEPERIGDDDDRTHDRPARESAASARNERMIDLELVNEKLL